MLDEHGSQVQHAKLSGTSTAVTQKLQSKDDAVALLGDDTATVDRSLNSTGSQGRLTTLEKPPTPARNRSSSFPVRGFQPPLAGSKHETTNGAPRRSSVLPPLRIADQAQVLASKLSPTQLYELTSAPESLPVRPASPELSPNQPLTETTGNAQRPHKHDQSEEKYTLFAPEHTPNTVQSAGRPRMSESQRFSGRAMEGTQTAVSTPAGGRPMPLVRSMSIPFDAMNGRPGADVSSRELDSPVSRLQNRHKRTLADTTSKARYASHTGTGSDKLRSPPATSVPLPPFSLPTYLQLELSSDRPSPLYIKRPSSSDLPYESSQVKFQRLLNFLLLPSILEQTLLFGALTCLDSWLYTFTVLPLRFCHSLWLLVIWCSHALFMKLEETILDSTARVREYLHRFGMQHMLKSRSRRGSGAGSTNGFIGSDVQVDEALRKLKNSRHSRRRHIKSFPSALRQHHKADLLQGLLILASCMVLTRFDASRMYHNIRGQAAIKLYVIYNVLEVCDRLFSALGQDILECLFSAETLERDSDGRTKLLRPFWMFLLALLYVVIHATALFYQVITLNVAVNSYSNALLTLLMSNQFVEIKGTVFKKFEKENLFQLTCADIVERFQLWLMLLIIALRNIVEVGGLSIGTGSFLFSSSTSPTTHQSPPKPNVTNPATSSFSMSIFPNAFTILPALVPFQVLSPFLLVLGSEMLVDWVKHAYITKFNATSLRIYARFLDILSRDYYSHAFVDQNLTRRLGLPVIPLACLFIRAALQTYHMFLATNIAAPSLLTATTSLAVDEGSPSEPTSSPIMAQLDAVLRRALGHSSFGGGASSSRANSWRWTIDDGIALATMFLFFLALYVLLLALKLALGMILLGFARGRYRNMRGRENESVVELESKRLGGWGVTEVGEERRKVIYDEAPDDLARLREREAKARTRETESAAAGLACLEKVERYQMVGKRIW